MNTAIDQIKSQLITIESKIKESQKLANDPELGPLAKEELEVLQEIVKKYDLYCPKS